MGRAPLIYQKGKTIDRGNIENKPTGEEWADLYQAAIGFKRVAPWQWMTDEDLFAVENPSDGRKVARVVGT